MVTTGSERVLLWGSAAVALFAVAARLHSIAAYPAMHDWDAGGHALNVVDLLERHWPDPRSWCGSHPPLYYALSALLSLLLPDRIPIHVTMRLLSSAAWFGTVALVWRSLGGLVGPVNAAIVGALLLGIPGLTIASSMMTNDALCALFVTATLVRLLATPRDVVASWRSIVVTGMLAGLAAATKATGIAAIGIAAGCYAWRGRRDPRRAIGALALLAVASGAIAAPHYLRLFAALSGSPYDILAVRTGSQEKEVIANVVHAIARATTRHSSFTALVHAALWNDPTAVYLPRGLDARLPVRALSAGGLLVGVVAIAGALRLAATRALWSRVALVLVFGVGFLAALAPHAVDRPYIVLTKTNYLLPEALPLGILLAVGLGALRGRRRDGLAATLLAIAALGVGVTVYGWWDVVPAPSGPTLSAPSSNPVVGAVDRYFEDRARDPIRALRRLTPELQLAHQLRLVDILGVPAPPPEPSDSPAATSRLELARARVAWLELYNLIRWVQPIAAALDVKAVDLRDSGDTATVSVRIGAAGLAPPAAVDVDPWPFPSFEQSFDLERRDGAWMIARVEQTGLSNANAIAAFVAHPTRAGYDRVRAIGWRPPWEQAVAAALHESP